MSIASCESSRALNFTFRSDRIVPPGRRTIFFFFVCIMTPTSAQCTPMQLVQSEDVCDLLATGYRDLVMATHRNSIVRHKCMPTTKPRSLDDGPIPVPEIRLP